MPRADHRTNPSPSRDGRRTWQDCMLIEQTRPFIPTLGQQTDADNGNEPYVPYYRYLLSQENSDLPQVISNSYGDQEDVRTKETDAPVSSSDPKQNATLLTGDQPRVSPTTMPPSPAISSACSVSAASPPSSRPATAAWAAAASARTSRPSSSAATSRAPVRT